jgi:hypothetical protein
VSNLEYRVDNCPRCGKVYQINPHGLCLECRNRDISELQSCIDFMNKNRKANMEQLTEATGVELSRVVKFIQEGKIPMSDYVNLTYPCEVCKAPIREHKMCIHCRSRIKNDIQKMLESSPITESNAATYRIHKRDAT